MTTPYTDRWPSLDRLWTMRRQPFRHPHIGEQRVCPTCSHVYTPCHFRAHLRSKAHRDNRGWWRR